MEWIALAVALFGGGTRAMLSGSTLLEMVVQLKEEVVLAGALFVSCT